VRARALHPLGRRPGATGVAADVRARARRVLPLTALVALTGCAALAGAARAYYESTPAFIEHQDWRLRRTLAVGRFDSALSRVSSRDEDAPKDKLLRSLYDGLVSYYAGEFERSGVSLRAADDLAEDRYTKSISRGALSLISNDRVLAYMPGHNERLLVHYYAALGYLRRNDLEGAAVEVRRMSVLLQQFDEQRDSADISTRAFLRYFAGSVFDAAGERNDADVAYRNAASLAPRAAVPPTRLKGGQGEVVVLLERGFVAHRVEETLIIELGGTERDRWSKKWEKDEDVTAMTSLGTFLRQLDALEDRGVYRSGSRRLRRDRSKDSVEYVLKVAWPVFLPPVRQSEPASVIGAGGAVAAFALVGDLSEGIVSDYRRARTAILLRTIARGVVKYIAAEQAEKKKGETGKVIANFAGALLEHADTRSWHMLPADVSLARIALPAGRQRLTLRLGPSTGADPARTVDLGEVEVRPGGVSFVTTRLWPSLPGYGAPPSEGSLQR
jgi:hypothetical protein